jgi:hypothetical protein
VLALGSRPNDFAIPGLEQRALSLYSASDAERVRAAISKTAAEPAAPGTGSGGDPRANGGGSPGHVFGPVPGILRAVVVNGLVRERLRLIPHEQKREQLLTLTGLIEAGKLTPVLDRAYPLAGTAEGLRRVEQGHARGKVVITVA